MKLRVNPSQIVFVEGLEEQGYENFPRRLMTGEQNALVFRRPLPLRGLPQPIDELLERRNFRLRLENLAALHVLQHTISPDIDHSGGDEITKINNQKTFGKTQEIKPDSEAPSRPRVGIFVGHNVLRKVQVFALGVDVVRPYVANLIDQPPPRCVQVPCDHQVVA